MIIKPATDLAKKLGYQFKDESMIELALTHRSHGKRNNERLEFLGDSILNFVIAEALYRRFPEAKEGQLSRLRAQLVKGETLAELAREMKLGDYLRLGSGELKSGGYRRDSILADAVEAIIGAIYLDSNMDSCRPYILGWYQSRLEQTSLLDTKKDSKTRLQEFLQSRRAPLPDYELLSVSGEAHKQTFEIRCAVSLLDKPTEGKGSSRRQAEQNAAKTALDKLKVVK
ncbi:ribonuclease III [Amphritea sp. 2_MG-2023]|uniref:ribonuclease III n=1 Tax=Amphritea sp. 2_MG-2023 TaxID=3062682 RepID=UPI0020915F91|nr:MULTISPECIES: ribonuclease III [Amphritea]MDO6420543.1 ribonuclease III [Amphritea sp. 2_MG-2023]MDX2423357.1 ribonuclease III [Amphritea sp.]